MEDKKNKVVYLLGAGFSHAIADNTIPLTKDLGIILGKLFPFLIKKKYNFLPENIELFLTKIDLDLSENKKNTSAIEKARSKVNEKLYQTFKTSNFCRNTGAVEKWQLWRFFQRFFAQGITKKVISQQRHYNEGIVISESAKRISNLLFKENDSILTLNYDCYLENLLAHNKKWDPYTGYGKYLAGKYPKEENDLNINIYKLHGSVNFHIVGKSTNGKIETDIDFDLNFSGTDNEDSSFPGMGYSQNIEGEIQEFFIAPSYLKQFNYKGIFQIWKEATLKIQQADVLVIMGCSLRDEDYPLMFLISQISKHGKIFIIDHQAEKITKKLQTILPNSPDNIKSLGKEINNLTEEQVSQIYFKDNY